MADDSAGTAPRAATSDPAPGDGALPPEPFRPVASTIGTVAAGLLLATLFVPGGGGESTVGSVPLGTVARAAAVLALGVFLVHRRVDVPDRPAGVVATLAGLVVGVADLFTLFGDFSVWGQPLGLPLATAAAIPVVGMGVALVLALPSARVFSLTRGLGVATFVGTVGFLTSIIGAGLIAGLGLAIIGTEAISVQYPVLTVAAAVVTVGFVAVALDPLGKDRSWLDFSVPTLRELGVTVAGLVALLVVLQGLTALITELGLPAVESSVEQQARESATPEFLLVLVPLSWLAIAPSEELLYRGVVQKYLYDYVGRGGAVVASSAIFAVIHYSQYADPNPVRMAVSLFTVFLLSLVLGYTYARTDNLVVPILIHGTFNAISFLAMYVRITGGTGFV